MFFYSRLPHRFPWGDTSLFKFPKMLVFPLTLRLSVTSILWSTIENTQNSEYYQTQNSTCKHEPVQECLQKYISKQRFLWKNKHFQRDNKDQQQDCLFRQSPVSEKIYQNHHANQTVISNRLCENWFQTTEQIILQVHNSVNQNDNCFDFRPNIFHSSLIVPLIALIIIV